jgi:hypothetical protein
VIGKDGQHQRTANAAVMFSDATSMQSGSNLEWVGQFIVVSDAIFGVLTLVGFISLQESISPP